MTLYSAKVFSKLIIQENTVLSNGGEMMLYEKSSLGRKYTRLISGSPALFVSFVLMGLLLFLLLTLTTKLDVISTYAAEVSAAEVSEVGASATGASAAEGEITLSIPAIKTEQILGGTAYIYSDKNESVYPVFIEHAEKSGGKLILHFDLDGQETIHSLSSQSLFFDIPQGEETLLHRIFVKGGKSHG